MRHCLRLAVSLLLLMALFSSAPAQTSRGTLVGTVTDSQGAVITNASVTMTQYATGVTRQTTTNAAGIYRIDAVNLGTYSVSVKAAGFAIENKTGIEIQSARTSNID